MSSIPTNPPPRPSPSSAPLSKPTPPSSAKPGTSSATETSIKTDGVAKKVLQQAPGRFEAFVSKGVLPALNKQCAEGEKATAASVTEPLPEWLKTATKHGTIEIPLREETLGKSVQGIKPRIVTTTPVTCEYDFFTFGNINDPPTIVGIYPGYNFSEVEKFLRENYKEKNIILLQVPKPELFNAEARGFIADSFRETFKYKNDVELATVELKGISINPKLLTAEITLGSGRAGAVREVNIQSKHGPILNGIEIRPQGLQQKKPEKWIVYYNKNDATWEGQTAFLAKMAKDVGANVICCNYRGVMKSSGFPTKEEHLIEDGDAVVQHLRDQGVEPKNILLYGSSIGGAVATHVAEKRVTEGEKVSLMSDRSFSSLEAVIQKIGRVFDQYLPILTQLIRNIVAAIAGSYGWKLDSGAKLKTLLEKDAKVTIIHNRADQVVPMGAQAIDTLTEKQRKKVTTIPLEHFVDKGTREAFAKASWSEQQLTILRYAHNRPLQPNENELFVQAARNALGIAASPPQEKPAQDALPQAISQASDLGIDLSVKETEKFIKEKIGGIDGMEERIKKLLEKGPNAKPEK